ncbi:MAG: hypothetical protein ACYDHT_11895, partial [Solirubrobacteraceae bacterium]
FLSQLTGEKSNRPFEPDICGVSVDPASGEVFVADPAKKIFVFSSAGVLTGKIQKKLGEGACNIAFNDTNHRIYVANPGSEEGKSIPQKAAAFIYTLVAGAYELDQEHIIDGSNTPEKTFLAGTLEEPEGGGALHVAVAPKSGGVNSEHVYVSVGEHGVVDEFGPEGEYLKQLPLPVHSAPGPVAVGPAGEVYVANEFANQTAVDEFNPAGELLASNNGAGASGFTAVSGLALDAAGDLYVSDVAKRVVDEFDPAGGFIGKLTGSNTPAGNFAEPVGVAVNQQNGDVYVVDATVAENAGVPRPGVVDVFGPAAVGSGPFLENEGVADVTATTAKLQAQIDPSGVSTTYHFEYGPQGGALTETSETSLGAGQTVQQATAALTGLLANTTYQFRAVVTASGHPTEIGALRTFTTATEGSGVTLPDGRAWELVSPINKFGALIKGIGASGVAQASADGSRIAYSATGPLEQGVEANAGEAPALSTRGSSQWSTREIMPPDYPQTGPNVTGSKGLENRVFSNDLTLSIVDPFKEEPLLSPLASERAPYLRNLNDVACRITETTCYTPLVSGNGELNDVTSGEKFGGPSTGQSGTFGEVIAVGGSPDLQHVLIESNVPLKAGVEGPGLYEWNAASPPADRLQLVSVLPSGEPVGATEKPNLGAYRSGRRNVRHAVSKDGSLVVFSTQVPSRLYVRDMAIGKTVRVDAVKEGEPVVGRGPTFQTASADGSTIFFSDEQKLTEHSTAAEKAPELYACHVHVAEGQLTCPIEDLTEHVKGVGETARQQALVLEASESGSDVYYVADGVLSSNQNENGEEATPGRCGEVPPPGATCNLYSQHFNGAGWDEPTFIAKLAADDGPTWGARASGTERLVNGITVLLQNLTSRVSP